MTWNRIEAVKYTALYTIRELFILTNIVCVFVRVENTQAAEATLIFRPIADAPRQRYFPLNLIFMLNCTV